MNNTALIIVDVQNDFCEGGSLAVAGGAEVARRIGEYAKTSNYLKVIATRDHHIEPGDHFSKNPDYKDSWPVHCKAGTSGSDFHPNLLESIKPGLGIDAIFDKGEYHAAYSGFEGEASLEFTAVGVNYRDTLAHYLERNKVTEVHIVGIATDHCVKATALDAISLGLNVTILTDLVAGVDAAASDQALKIIHARRGRLTTSSNTHLEEK